MPLPEQQLESLLDEQVRYYRERAKEYDDWWLRRGRYDRGTEANARWFADAATVEKALSACKLTGEVLELAGGTGVWTERLASTATHLTVIDGSPEMLQLNRSRLGVHEVSYVVADLFSWEPQQTYDACFFGFWLSHVPEERFERFWEKVWRSLRPGGRVFFIDSVRSDLASAADHILPAPEQQTMVRRLADGREFQIVKRFYQPDALQRRLEDLGWEASVRATPEFFIFGEASRD